MTITIHKVTKTPLLYNDETGNWGVFNENDIVFSLKDGGISAHVFDKDKTKLYPLVTGIVWPTVFGPNYVDTNAGNTYEYRITNFDTYTNYEVTGINADVTFGSDSNGNVDRRIFTLTLIYDPYVDVLYEMEFGFIINDRKIIIPHDL